MKKQEIISSIEAILFANGEPLSLEKLAEALSVSVEDIEVAIAEMNKEYAKPERGLCLICKDTLVQLATRPERGDIVEAFAKETLSETLGKSALETLSIIAYRGPITRSEIEAIRGVNCSAILRNLLLRELIERKESVEASRGYSYTISFPFLRTLGVSKVEDLPQFETLSKDERVEAIVEKEKEKQEE